MTEYKQLTSGGPSVCVVCTLFTRLAYATHVSPGSPDGMFTAGERGAILPRDILTPSPVRSWVRLSIYSYSRI